MTGRNRSKAIPDDDKIGPTKQVTRSSVSRQRQEASAAKENISPSIAPDDKNTASDKSENIVKARPIKCSEVSLVKPVDDQQTTLVQPVEEQKVSLVQPMEEEQATVNQSLEAAHESVEHTLNDSHCSSSISTEAANIKAIRDEKALIAEAMEEPLEESSKNDTATIPIKPDHEKIFNKHNLQLNPELDKKLTLDFVDYSVSEFLEKIKVTLDLFYYNDSEYICKAALERYPKNYDILWQCSKAYVDIGRTAEATDCLTKCIHFKPDENYEQYKLMASLACGKPAVDYLSTACNLIKCEILRKGEEKYFIDLCKCYCRIAETYLFQLDSEENYLVKCLDAIKQAIRVNSDHPMGFQTMVKYLIYMREFPEAKEFLKSSIDKWYPIYMEKQAVVDNIELPDEYPDDMKILTYEERLETISLLIDVKDYDMAEKIIKILLTEDDQVVDIQYYYGLLLYRKGESFHKEAKYRLDLAILVNEMTRTDNVEIVVHLEELLKELENVDDEDDCQLGDEDKVDENKA